MLHSTILATALILRGATFAGTFSLDDGTADTYRGTPGGDLLALNHFDTGGRIMVIDQISVLWNPLSTAVSPTVALYSDPNSDGNPSDAAPLLIYPVYVQPNVVILNNATLQDYDIPPTAVEGSFFVAAYLSDATADFDPVIGVDTSSPRLDQSWIVENTNGTGLLDFDHPVTTSTLVTPLNTYINGNHMIRAHYTVVPPCVTPPAGLVSWWRAEGDALDTVGGNDGTSVISVGFAPGKVGQTFVFDGTNSSITIPASSSLNVQSFTIEGWIDPEDVSSQRPIAEFGSGKTWSGVHFWISVPLGGGPGTLFANIRSLSSGLDENIISSAPGLIQANQWSHVALTFDQTSGEARLFLNGTNVVSRNLGSIIPRTELPFNIGLRPVGVEDGGGLRFLGRIDELSLYDRALTESKIQAIYDAGSSGKCVPPPTFPPTITGQPADQVKMAGDTATFEVLAMGTRPLGYQWFFNGTDLPDGTNRVLILPDVQTNQAGLYFVKVTNPYGSVASSNVFLRVNHPPVADASATHALVVAPTHCPLKVVLDGSRSSDPDGDPLKYFWFGAGATNAFAIGVVAVVTLPLGSNSLTLVVDDGLALDVQTFAVHVVSAAQAIERMIGIVDAEAPKPHPLIVSLSAALSSLLRGNETAAMNQLEAFQNKVRAQIKPADPPLAARLTRFAQATIDALRCGSNPGEHRGRIRGFTRHDDGEVKIKFTAPSRPVYIIEVSSNLVDWERIGVATDTGVGEFEFEDANHVNGPTRFYRIVVP